MRSKKAIRADQKLLSTFNTPVIRGAAPKEWETKHEVVFSDHQRIKYVHDITRFCHSPAEKKLGCFRILVAALNSNVDFHPDIPLDIQNDLAEFKIIPKSDASGFCSSLVHSPFEVRPASQPSTAADTQLARQHIASNPHNWS